MSEASAILAAACTPLNFLISPALPCLAFAIRMAFLVVMPDAIRLLGKARHGFFFF